MHSQNKDQQVDVISMDDDQINIQQQNYTDEGSHNFQTKSRSTISTAIVKDDGIIEKLYQINSSTSFLQPEDNSSMKRRNIGNSVQAQVKSGSNNTGSDSTSLFKKNEVLNQGQCDLFGVKQQQRNMVTGSGVRANSSQENFFSHNSQSLSAQLQLPSTPKVVGLNCRQRKNLRKEQSSNTNTYSGNRSIQNNRSSKYRSMVGSHQDDDDLSQNSEQHGLIGIQGFSDAKSVNYDEGNNKIFNQINNAQKESTSSNNRETKESSSKVIHSKTICYVSAFHLNINDWFSEYENIEIFNINLQKSLGGNWAQIFEEAVKSPYSKQGDKQEEQIYEGTNQTNDSLHPDSEYYQLMFNLYLMTQYQATNIAEAYMTQAHLQASKILNNQEQGFEIFFNNALSFINSKGYSITNMTLFKQVVRSFFCYAQNEYEKILKKIEQDQQTKIKFTEKALQQFNDLQRKEAMKERERELNQKIIDSNKRETEQTPTPKNLLGLNFDDINKMGYSIPGFQTIKDRVIKPLLVATEKVVEYYLNEETAGEIKDDENQINSGAQAINQLGEQLEDQTIHDEQQPVLMRKFEKLLITEKTSGKKRTFRELERWDIEKPHPKKIKRIDSSQSMISFGGHQKTRNTNSLCQQEVDNKSEDGKSVKCLKFNSRLLQKASAAVDLISQKIEFKNLMNQNVTASFVTVLMELTHDFIDKLEKQEAELIQQQVQLATSDTGNTPENLNIKFIKPSPHFYNKIMSLWFKFNHLNSNEDNNIAYMLHPQLRALFLDFCIKQFRQVGSWDDQLIKPLDNFIQIITQEHVMLQTQTLANQSSSDEEEFNIKTIIHNVSKAASGSSLMEPFKKPVSLKKKSTAMGQISMCTFFDNIKSQLAKQWEEQIVDKSGGFQKDSEAM